MNIILLSGGSGKRLWPLSNASRSKQFLELFAREDGEAESMLRRTYRRVCAALPNARVVVATAESQAATVAAQLGGVPICAEPCRRDTFPAIALGAAYLSEVWGVGPEEVVAVCPVDAGTGEDFFATFAEAAAQAASGAANLALVGVEPTGPSEKYGYILPTSRDKVSAVQAFKEKPDARTAAAYIARGALWNAGVFAFRLGYVLEIAREMFGTARYEALREDYANLPAVSFDRAVAERELHMRVVRFAGEWKDLGTWDALTGAMDSATRGNALAVDCADTHVINELPLPVVALGVRNLAIAATPDGILVTDKAASERLKDCLEGVRPAAEQLPWGERRVLEAPGRGGEGCAVRRLCVRQGEHLPYRRNAHGAVLWAFTEGEGRLIQDGRVRRVRRGDAAMLPAGTRFALWAETALSVVEVRFDAETGVDAAELERQSADGAAN